LQLPVTERTLRYQARVRGAENFSSMADQEAGGAIPPGAAALPAVAPTSGGGANKGGGAGGAGGSGTGGKPAPKPADRS
jgi:hypothetical protein